MSLTSKAPNPEKGKRYLAQLDQALCSGAWSEVPELARKTDKHAPERRCLTLTARTEAQIASAAHRPTSSSSTGTSSIHSLGEAIPNLQAAIAAAHSVPEDTYCASVCLAEVHWLQEDHDAALIALQHAVTPSGIADGRTVPLGWLEVCNVKASFLRVAILEARGQEQEAHAIYRAIASQTPGSRTPELRRWTERLLGRACMYSHKRTRQPSLSGLNEALSMFRAWASFWQRVNASGTSGGRTDTPRRQVWKAYYDLLSVILRHYVLYNPSASRNSDLLIVPWTEISDERYVDAKVRQREELKRVEATYESLLLSETAFPKASQTNFEVEAWIEQAVGNWSILCGAEWTDAELGDGGREAVGRGILDALYRAATKTFHSTAILRQLFTVHAALGEFDLAMHAFNSYVEIAGKGKARAEKTGVQEAGFDSDDITIVTAASAVHVLCKYGDREQGQKAMDVASILKGWLGRKPPPTSSEESQASEDDKTGQPKPPSHPTHSTLQPETLASAYRAIGTAQACWARLTYETDSRPGLQADALANMQRAQSYDREGVETAFALARVLVEMRDVAAATMVIKRAIEASRLARDADGGDEDEQVGSLGRLMPMWHLLALCLTAKDEYEPAVKVCQAAFDQFGGPSLLFGQAGSRLDSQPRTRALRGLVDQFDSFEKEAMVEVKMSQLTLVELTEGVENAVDLGDELLGLYARLFGSPEQFKVPSKPVPIAASSAGPGPARAGTLRSIAGSIRSKSGPNSSEKDNIPQPLRASPVTTRSRAGSLTRPGPVNSLPESSSIAITVTNENGNSGETGKSEHHRHHLHLPLHLRGHHNESKDVGGVRPRKSAENLSKMSAVDDEAERAALSNSDVTDHAKRTADVTALRPYANDNVPSNPQQSLEPMKHNAPQDAWPSPVGHADQAEQDIRLSAPNPTSNGPPLPLVGSLHGRQHRFSVLIKVWLFTAELYIKADLYDDASGAIEEAFRLVESYEAEMGAANANARRLFERGWGGGKSVDALWADVWCARGDLASARELPFEAMSAYEQAVSHYPDHPEAIIGVSDFLMDIYEEKLPAEVPKSSLAPLPSASGSLTPTPSTTMATTPRPTTANSSLASAGRTAPSAALRSEPSPDELNRLAARDRAYMLLSNLTKLGTGWDNAEAWSALARAHELSRHVEKAKQALWWVVDLEESKPMRPWESAAPGGYVL